MSFAHEQPSTGLRALVWDWCPFGRGNRRLKCR
jgi:hypothetical protein